MRHYRRSIGAIDKREWGENAGLGLCLVALAVMSAGACHRTFSAQVSQPNPLINPLDTLRDTEVLTIVTGDMELSHPRAARVEGKDSLMSKSRYPLLNQANFTVVSRDRLRFHVQIEHKWKQYTDISTWKATLYDDQGNQYAPTAIDTVKARHLVETWSFEKRSTRRDGFGNIVQINDDGHRDRQPLGSLSVFRGRGDFVFYQRDIFGPDVRSMTLELTRSGITFRYRWIFADEESDSELALRSER